MRTFLLCISFLVSNVAFVQGQKSPSSGLVPSKMSAPLTQEQGEEILNELRLIRKALEDRRGPPDTTAANPVPAEGVKLTTRKDQFVLGSSQAPVTLVEFSDFQCPYCTMFSKQTFPRLKEAYIDTGKVRFVSREYPMEGHPNAMDAALTAHCAGLQNRYWEMRSLIIDGGSDLSTVTFERYAQKLALDRSKFRACVKDGLSVAAIQGDKADGLSIGVTGTPGFLIGHTAGDTVEGVRIDGAQPYEQFAAAIDSALKTESPKPRSQETGVRGYFGNCPASWM